jgi:NAD(P)H-dependent FMN reductase
MPGEPRQTIPELLGTIRAGRRSAQVDRLPLGQFEGRNEVATALIDLADPDLPVVRHRLGETDDASFGAVGLSKTLSREVGLAIVAPANRNGYPGALKNAFDYLPAVILRRKPI